MTDKEPERLKATGETPEQLVRALRALGRDRDVERLARVASRLTASLSAASGAPAGTGLQSVLGSKLVTAGVVIGLGTLGVIGYQLATKEPTPIERPAAPPAPPPSQLAPQATPARMPAQASEPAPERSAAEREQASPLGHDEPRSKRVPKRALGATTGEPTRSASETLAASPAETETTKRAADVAEAPSPAAPEELMAAARAPASPPPSEELLVHRARKAAASDPAAALKLLDEHAARFPSGMLVPEREVLAIEVLRSLGRTKEAEQRLLQFQKRYPKSIHLRRLEQGRATEQGD